MGETSYINETQISKLTYFVISMMTMMIHLETKLVRCVKKKKKKIRGWMIGKIE